MASHLVAVLALCACAAGSQVRDCPYGYGDGCDRFWDSVGGLPGQQQQTIDPAAKAKVMDILGGLITGLSNKPVPRLLGVKQAVVRSANALEGQQRATQWLGSLLSTLQHRSQAKSAALLSALAGEKVEETSVISFQGLIADVLASKSDGIADICPFGYGCGGGGTIDAATKDQVANILKGIIKNMSGGHRKSLMQVSLTSQSAGVRQFLGSLLATLRSSQHSGKATEVVADLTGSKVASAQTLADLLEQGMKTTDPCKDFGYGCAGGAGGPISGATKDKVANILKGIIRSMGGR